MVAHQTVADERLLRALAEQLKLPLIQIARQSEMGMSQNVIQTADMALQLIDSFLLSTDVHAQQTLALEPVSISSILYSTCEDLKSYAKLYNCDTEVSLGGKYAPIMGNFEALRAAFYTLGCALIEAQSIDGPRHIVLAAHRSATGIVAGIFGEQPDLSADMFRRARALYGSSRQPLPNTSSSSSAGVFVADSLLSSIAQPLRVAQHHKLNGLATTLIPSHQLQLV